MLIIILFQNIYFWYFKHLLIAYVSKHTQLPVTLWYESHNIKSKIENQLFPIKRHFTFKKHFRWHVHHTWPCPMSCCQSARYQNRRLRPPSRRHNVSYHLQLDCRKRDRHNYRRRYLADCLQRASNNYNCKFNVYTITAAHLSPSPSKKKTQSTQLVLFQCGQPRGRGYNSISKTPQYGK